MSARCVVAARLLLFWHTIYAVTAIPACLQCLPPLSLVTPRWNYNHTAVPNIVLMCNVDVEASECNVNTTGLVEPLLNSSLPFTSIDLRFNCLSDKTRLFFTDTTRTEVDNSICAVIRIQDCNTTWLDISYLGSRYHLIEVERIFTSQAAAERNVTLDLRLPGLDELDEIMVTLTNFSGKANIGDLLPYKTLALDKVATLCIQCTGTDEISAYCPSGSVTYNSSQLQRLFPHLQIITLAGVYPIDSTTHLNFPWDNDTMRRPLNFSSISSNYEFPQQHTENYLHARTLAIIGQIGVDLSYACPYRRRLNSIVFIECGVTWIPGDCFTPDQHEQTILHFLDISKNNISILPVNIFRGLTALQKLHLDRTGLTEVQAELFIDLIGLQILDITNNTIESLEYGVFKNLFALKKLYASKNNISSISRFALPRYSNNLTLVDFKQNLLSSLPYDCLTLPNLFLCNCDHNKISLNNLKELIHEFNPIKMYLQQPLAYYGETYSHANVGLIHESSQCVISLRNNGKHEIDYNKMWTRDEKMRLASLLSYFQFNLETGIHASSLDCDCNLFDLKNFVNSGEARDLIKGSVYSHNLLLSSVNFQTWKCEVHSILRSPEDTSTNYTSSGPFLLLADENFVCENKEETCSPCQCYKHPVGNTTLADCSSKNLKKLPLNIPIPDENEELIVSLETNTISEFVYTDKKWLQHVTRLNLQDAGITFSNSQHLLNFLNFLKKNTHLYLAGNNIKSLPVAIQKKNYTKLSIGNQRTCDCNKWMKRWLQTNMNSILHASTIHCTDYSHPIVQLDSSQFKCQPEVTLTIATTLCSFMIAAIIVIISCYVYRYELKILLFEKLNWHPFDKQNDEEKNYDLYLMYCQEDEVWVINTLLVGLEQLGYRTFIGERDSITGASHAAEMSETFAKTHRVVVVISQSFINSTNAMSDFYHAHEHEQASARRRRFLVMIKLGKRIDFGEHDIFRTYLSTNYFVPIQDKRFWARFRYWLHPLRVKELPAAIDNIAPDTEGEPSNAADDNANLIL